MSYEERIAAFPKVIITSKPHIMGGTPCIDGTRVPAETLLACINAKMTVAEIFHSYPWLPMRAVEAIVDWAEQNKRDISLPVRRVSGARIDGHGA